MKKRRLLFLFLAVSIIFLLSISLVSASWYSPFVDFWNKITGKAITGRAVAPPCETGDDCPPGTGCAFVNEEYGKRCLDCASPYLCGGGPPTSGHCGIWGNNCNCGTYCAAGMCDGVPCKNGVCNNPTGQGVCVEEGCTPKTCAQLGKQCGIWPNGCEGGTVDCGTCTTGTCINGQCGGGGTCTDSDKSPSYMDGLDYYTKGTATKGSVSYTDECLSETLLKEAYCSGGSSGTPSTLTFDCLNVPFNGNWVCQDGKCVKLPTCTNNDGCNDNNLCTDDTCVSGNCKYTPINCPDGEICDPDTGNCIPSTCSLPSTISGVSGVSGDNQCKICENDQWKNAPDGTPCQLSTDPEDEKNGVCKSGNCKEKTCDDILGSNNWISCPTSSTDKTKCCPKGNQCCGKVENEDPVCCPYKTNEGFFYKCGVLDARVLGKDVNSCDITGCNPASTHPQECKWTTQVLWKSVTQITCCKKAPIETCSYQISSIHSVKSPVCVKNKCNTDKGEFPCGSPKKGKLCCKKGEQCLFQAAVGYCNPTKESCENEGKTFCPGKGIAKGKMNKCCVAGQICFNSPNGAAQCVDKTPNPQPTSQNTNNNILITSIKKILKKMEKLIT